MLSGPTARFVRAETARLLTAPVAVGTLFLFAAFQVYSVVAWTGDCAAPDHAAAFGGYSCTTSVSVAYLLPLVALVVGGTAAASERARGAEILLAVRGLVGPSYARARIVAGALAAGIGIGATGLVAVIAGLIAHPWRDAILKDPEVFYTQGPPAHPGDPFPSLWSVAPLLNDLAVVLFVAVAAASVAVLGTAIGMWISNPIAVIPFVLVAMVVGILAVPESFSMYVNVENLLNFSPSNAVVRDVSPVLRPVVHLAIWIVIVSLSLPAASLGARRAIR